MLLISNFPPPRQSGKRARKTRRRYSVSEVAEVLAAPLFIEDAGFSSTITMVSELNYQVTAQVLLLDRNGAQITYQTVAGTLASASPPSGTTTVTTAISISSSGTT